MTHDEFRRLIIHHAEIGQTRSHDIFSLLRGHGMPDDPHTFVALVTNAIAVAHAIGLPVTVQVITFLQALGVPQIAIHHHTTTTQGEEAEQAADPQLAAALRKMETEVVWH